MRDSAAVLRKLGLARRAGALQMGASAVLRAMERERPGIVFLATDAGADIARKVERSRGHHRVERMFEGQELADAFGREQLRVISVHDPGFVSGIADHLTD